MEPNDTAEISTFNHEITADKIPPNEHLTPILQKAKEPLQSGRKVYQYLSTFLSGFVSIEAGLTLGWTAPVLPFLESEFSFMPILTKTETSWITSLLALGAIIGAVPSGKVADLLGRKRALALGSLPFLVSWMILIFAKDIGSIYFARFIGGIGAGAACVLVPVYIGEISEPSIRGTLNTFFPLMFSLGIVTSYTVGAYFSYLTFNIFCCVLLTPFLLTIYFLPESPMWLVHRGNKYQVNRCLEILRGPDYDIMKEIQVLQLEANRLEDRKGGIRDLFGTKAGRKAIFTTLGLMWFQQMSGIDAVLTYTVNIFEEAASTIEPFFATIVIGIIEVVMAIVVAIVIDRFGRKPLLVISGSLMTVCLAVVGYYFHLQSSGSDVRFIGWLPLTCLSLFNVVFSVGYGSVPFVIISEIFPPETKGVASSLSIMLNWTLVFAVTKMFPSMVDVLGKAVSFWIFGTFTLLSAFFALFFVPETKGKTFQEIQLKLERKHRNTETDAV